MVEGLKAFGLRQESQVNCILNMFRGINLAICNPLGLSIWALLIIFVAINYLFMKNFDPSPASRLNAIGKDIIGCAFNVRNIAGRYFREKYYKHALAYELSQKGYSVRVEVLVPSLYKGIEIDDALFMDIVVDDSVVIEVKAIPQIGQAEYRQLLTYLMLSKYRLGYIINFGVERFSVAARNEVFSPKQGIYRLVNNI